MLIADPIDAHISVDRLTPGSSIPYLAHLAPQLSGLYPFARSVNLDAPCAVMELLPADAVVVRCVTTDVSVHLLANTSSASIAVEARARSAVIKVAASTQHEVDPAVADILQRAPSPPADTIPVRIWHDETNRGGRSFHYRIDTPVWVDIARNYPTSTRSALDRLLHLSRPVGLGKLILWHGTPGPGKPTALRALPRAWAPWCQGQYVTDPSGSSVSPPT